MLADQEVKRTNWLARAVLAGFCATIVMIVVFFWGYAVAVPLSHMHLPDAQGAFGSGASLQRAFSNLVDNRLVSFARNELYAALAMHALIGIFLAVLYARFVEPRLSGSGWMRGLMFSLVPWVLSLVVFMPAVGVGFLGLGLGAGLLPALGNLITHLAYGATLGAVYAPASQRMLADDETGERPHLEQLAMQRAESGAVFGLVIGLVGGLVLGIAAMLVSQLSHVYTILGYPDSYYLTATTLLGGCLGALIGTLTSLPTTVSRTA